MSVSVLISDKSIPCAVSLAASVRATGASVALLSPSETAAASPSEDAASRDGCLVEPRWKRSSPLSARTALLDVSTRLNGPDAAVVVFDATALSAPLSAADSPSIVVDSLVTGYAHLARELCSAFDRRGHGRLVFALTRRPRRAGFLGFGGVGGEAVEPASAALAVSLAEASFSRLAEETARWIASRGSREVTCLLVSREQSVPDERFVPWLASRVVSGRGVVSRSRSLTLWAPALAPEVFGILP